MLRRTYGDLNQKLCRPLSKQAAKNLVLGHRLRRMLTPL